jgi:hypothetical protein
MPIRAGTASTEAIFCAGLPSPTPSTPLANCNDYSTLCDRGAAAAVGSRGTVISGELPAIITALPLVYGELFMIYRELPAAPESWSRGRVSVAGGQDVGAAWSPERGYRRLTTESKIGSGPVASG